MMRMVVTMKKLAAVFLLFLCVTKVLAQEECAALVEQALAATGDVCTGVERNQACYGNISLTATLRPDATDVQFVEAGDRADLTVIEDIALDGLDAQEDVWGIAILQVQANLPDTLPGQNVTMLLFGDVEVENAGTLGMGTTLSGTANTGANIRRSPSQNGTIIGSLISGDSVQVVGRLEDGTWLQVQLPGQETVGWVFGELLNIDGDVNALEITEAGVPQFGPMQAFYFRSGIGDAACAEAPESGVLVQTPEGAGMITLNVNDATITLGSTAFLQAEPGGEMTVNLIEGGAVVQTEWDVEYVPAGARVRMPLRDDGRVEVADYTPEPYNYDRLLTLPISLLPREITIARPLTQAQINGLRATPTPLPPTATPIPPTVAITVENWTVTQTVVRDTCEIADNSTFGIPLTFDEDRTLVGLNWMGFYFAMSPSGLGYVGSVTDSNNINYTVNLVFQGPTFFTADASVRRPSGAAAGCTTTLRWDGRYP